jgi:hypothetical protein
MPTAEVTGLFGLGGVVLGGAMAMLSARWQAAAISKGRIAEREVLRNERVLRDEASRRTAILDMLATLERLSSAESTIRPSAEPSPPAQRAACRSRCPRRPGATSPGRSASHHAGRCDCRR